METKQAAIIAAAILILLGVLVFGAAFFMGGASVYAPPLPEEGVVPVDVPFSANGQEYVQVKYMVQGQYSDPLLSGAFFSNMPSKTNFKKSPPPDQTGYEGFVPYSLAEEEGQKVLTASVPNAYDATYVRLYAFVNGHDYWSDEFVIYP